MVVNVSMENVVIILIIVMVLVLIVKIELNNICSRFILELCKEMRVIFKVKELR